MLYCLSGRQVVVALPLVEKNLQGKQNMDPGCVSGDHSLPNTLVT